MNKTSGMENIISNQNWFDDDFKWVYAIDDDDGRGWVVLAASKKRLDLNETASFDHIPMGRIQKSRIASFRVGYGWNHRRPHYMIDYRDHSNTSIKASVGMMTINQANAGLF